MIKKRDTSIDSIKFVLIAFVVLGHTFQLNMGEGINANLFSFVNSFHMPAFIILSGYFYRDAESRKFWHGILELLLVILIFQIIYFSRDWLEPFDFSLKGFWNRVSHIYMPLRAMWYILSLCFWRMIMRFYPKKIRDSFFISIFISLGVSLLAGFVPLTSQFSFQRTLVFFPYFLLGYHIHQNDFWLKIRGLNKWMCGAIIIAYFVLILIVPNFPDSMLTGSFSYFSCLANWKTMFGLRVVSYLWMLPLTICVLNVIPDSKFFAEQGKNTMFYYLYHPFFIWFMNWFVINYNAPTSSLFLCLYTIISMFIMYWLSKIPILNFLTKPVTLLKRKK